MLDVFPGLELLPWFITWVAGTPLLLAAWDWVEGAPE